MTHLLQHINYLRLALGYTLLDADRVVFIDEQSALSYYRELRYILNQFEEELL